MNSTLTHFAVDRGTPEAAMPNAVTAAERYPGALKAAVTVCPAAP
ncbi:hypothetical protein OG539_03215 [Actinacidiphila glaucinigra]|nr:hypothetical protein [Actinacidiphila glaucinigra]WSD64579.1 hypothetical protein OIE69_39650 [Actinacidiphila glaucinigra]